MIRMEGEVVLATATQEYATAKALTCYDGERDIFLYLYQLKSRVCTGTKLHPIIGIILDIHMKSNMFIIISFTYFDTLQTCKTKLNARLEGHQKYKAP